MMSSNYTTNYNLPIWEKDDAFLRTEFNECNEKIDSALGGLATALAEDRMVIGTYTGDGTTAGRFIPLPFTPTVLLVSGHWGNTNTQYGQLTIAFGDYVHSIMGGGGCDTSGPISIVEGGFQVTGTAHNIQGFQERYLAIR
jgi:hypothetical protein